MLSEQERERERKEERLTKRLPFAMLKPTLHQCPRQNRIHIRDLFSLCVCVDSFFSFSFGVILLLLVRLFLLLLHVVGISARTRRWHDLHLAIYTYTFICVHWSRGYKPTHIIRFAWHRWIGRWLLLVLFFWDKNTIFPLISTYYPSHIASHV